MNDIELSVVVPLYNEEENIEELYRRLRLALADIGMQYEILFVDDGSHDGTFRISRQLAQTDKNLRVIKFRRNYGQTPAMVAGIDHAKGAIIVTMDGDLQNDPNDIPRFLAELGNEHDVVVGWRHKRKDKWATRKLPSVVANWLIVKVTGVPVRDNGCSLKAYRADVIKRIPLYSEMHRFIPAMASLSGARIAEIKVNHYPRRYGVSKYGLSRIFRVVSDLVAVKALLTFAPHPMRWFAILSTPAVVMAILCFYYALAQIVFLEGSTPVVTAGIGILSIALAMFLLMEGAIGELIYRTRKLDLKELSVLTVEVMDVKKERKGQAKPSMEGV